MNFSEPEFKELLGQYQRISENFKTRFASKKRLFEKVAKRNEGDCKSCDTSELTAIDLDK
jgi:hypothetical protein